MGEFTDKAKGNIKEALGEAKQGSRNSDVRADGKAQKAEGKIDKAKGSVKGALGDRI